LFSDGSDDRYDYSSAWFDSMSTGRAGFGRGSLATLDQLPKKRSRT
jgi:decaprenylphospho-beta-D-ribofuranose 2-oxidase